MRNLTPKVIVGPDEGWYFLFLDDLENKESAILRSNEYQLLQSIKTAMVTLLMFLYNIEIGRFKEAISKHWASSCCSNPR